MLDGGGCDAHAYADLSDAQALDLELLSDLQFEAGFKDSPGLGIVHAGCCFSFDNLSLCLFKLDHHISALYLECRDGSDKPSQHK